MHIAARAVWMKFVRNLRTALAIKVEMWYNNPNAGMLELADEADSKSVGSDTVRVRPPLPAVRKP